MTSFYFWQQLAAEAGRFMCCLCFEAFPLDQAYQDADGQAWDMCQACGQGEQAARG